MLIDKGSFTILVDGVNIAKSAGEIVFFNKNHFKG